MDLLPDLLPDGSVPSPVRQNFMRAFFRLCSSAVDIPIAHLEGRADERRAITEARINLVRTTGDQIARQMEVDPEYARRAVTQFGQKVLREQVNLDLITQVAADELMNDADPDVAPDVTDSDPSIDDDWLHNFDNEARHKSSDDMQRYFGHLLAGEIRRPGTFSIRTVKVLGNLDRRVAALFKVLCSISMVVGSSRGPFEARVASLGRHAGTNGLADYGLDFDSLNVLSEYGLILPDYNTWRDYRSSIGTLQMTSDRGLEHLHSPFLYQQRYWILVPTKDHDAKPEFRVDGVAFTKAGLELHKIVPIDPVPSYTTALADYFRSKKLEMMRVDGHRDFRPVIRAR